MLIIAVGHYEYFINTIIKNNKENILNIRCVKRIDSLFEYFNETRE